MNPKISLMIHTASHDCFLKNQGINSAFQMIVDCLLQQSFKEFEFIYIDTYYDDNKLTFQKIDTPFVVKHVPVHSEHRYWYDQNFTYIAAAKNTGILYADGELLVTIDDSEILPPHLLQKYWEYYQAGFLMHAFHNRMKSVQTQEGRLKFPIQGDVYCNDSRKFDQVCYHLNGTWTYAGTSFSLKDAIRLNGFNEKMDGYKGGEDVEFGMRLVRLGRKLVIDQNAYVYILDHDNYMDAPGHSKKLNHFIALESYGIMAANQELFEIEANKNNITPKHMEIIKRETLKYRGFDPLAPENSEKLRIWSNVPSFNLNNQRIALRQNNWSWQ